MTRREVLAAAVVALAALSGVSLVPACAARPRPRVGYPGYGQGYGA